MNTSNLSKVLHLEVYMTTKISQLMNSIKTTSQGNSQIISSNLNNINSSFFPSLIMPIFNETFTDDKPIYYPSNWQSGKTATELYEEWKLTTQYFLLSNVLQCVIAAAWLCFVFVVCNAIKQMWRLYNLPDDKRQKIEHRRYINKTSIMSVAFVAFIAFFVTVSLGIMNEFTRFALLKGFVFCFILIGGQKVYSRGKSYYLQFKQRRDRFQRIKKEEEAEE